MKRNTTVALLCRPAVDHHVGGRRDLGQAGAGHVDHDRLGRARPRPGCGRRSAAPACVPDPGREPVAGHEAAAPSSGSPASSGSTTHAVGQRRSRPRRRVAGEVGVGVQPAQPLERREPPDLLAPGRHRVVGEVERPLGVQVRVQPAVSSESPRSRAQCRSQSQIVFLGALGVVGEQGGVSRPPLPSAARSAGSARGRTPSGSSLAIGSTKPRTIIAIASSCSMPRDIR